MINFEMTKEEAAITQNVIGRYLDHLRVEINHTDRREFREALEERELLLTEIINRLKAKIQAGS